MKRFILIIILVIGGVILGLGVFAQGAGIGISPMTFELTANPGEVIINQVKVYNPSSATIGIKMELEDFTVAGEIGHVKLEPAETETYSIAKWITFEPGEFTLEPGAYKFVTFTVSVPEKAEPGGHYGSVIAGTTAVVGGGVTGAAVAGRVGSLVLLSVAGNTKEELGVKDFNVGTLGENEEFTPRNYFEQGPVTFQTRFENTGTIHVKPRGYVTITNWLGKKVADVEFPQRNVLPNSVRKIETSWNQKWLWAGKYMATLNGSYGTANIPLTPTVITFWAFPWKVGLGILIVLILLILSRKRWLAAFRVLIRGEKV